VSWYTDRNGKTCKLIAFKNIIKQAVGNYDINMFSSRKKTYKSTKLKEFGAIF